MAETASIYDTMVTTEWAVRPVLQVVSDGPDSIVDRAEEDEARVWRSAAAGAVIGWVAGTTGITIAGTLGGMEASSALGIGAFVGIFGGLGFGFMLGAATGLARQQSVDHA